MGLDRRLGEVEFVGEVVVRQATCDQPQDFEFARGQGGKLGGGAGGRAGSGEAAGPTPLMAATME